MVKVCSYNYPKSKEDEYKEYYEKYSYELHDFQKWSIESIVGGNHLLVCAPTGSGKTMPGEFALDFFHSKGKKTIYTSPIKALSNEKFYNFTQKYPHISIGLITGDIKTNPDADVLIMTTEILLNKLYQVKSTTPFSTSSISFEMDIENELGCVVFDEIHMINDESRGHVWEQCIMMLPKHVQMIGLSATLDDPERFAYWLENKGNLNPSSFNNEKIVYLAKKQIRAVPLIHYSFITVTTSIDKAIKDKEVREEIKKFINKPHIIQDAKGTFNDANYQNMNKMLKLFEKNHVYVKRQNVLNKVCEYLFQNEMLPALCYVFSRKQLEKCAEELTTNLLEFDSKIPYTVDRECEQIIRKLPNYEEYLHLPEYVNMVKLLRKGVGIHHAGLMPILREMTELLFAKGFIKVLFCTETMSVGINLPVKTTIFTDVFKFNGDIIRNLYSHEYTQAAGRAGRLGLDTVGHVIHLNNIFRNIDSVSYKHMMSGKPQILTSKFKISYNLLLNLIDIGDTNLVEFAKKSMVTNDLDNQMKEIFDKISKVSDEFEKFEVFKSNLRTPHSIVETYIELQNTKNKVVNKKRKEVERQIQQIQDEYKFIENDKVSYQKIYIKQKEYKDLEQEYNQLNKYFQSGVNTVLTLLKSKGFIHDTQVSTTNNNDLKLTIKGKIATQLREVHCLVFAVFLEGNMLDDFTSRQLVLLFSCFTNISVQTEVKDIIPKSNDKIVNENLLVIDNMYQTYKEEEVLQGINSGIDYNIQYDLLQYMNDWCESECIEDCKLILQKIGLEKEIFLGEFVKALLKINNIASEMEKIAEFMGNIRLLSKLKEIPGMLLKYVVTNQSLYV
jgi:superfamily II RNA helicase